MAKQKSANEQSGKVKIRVIEFEVEGNDTTLQESLKGITAALNRGLAAASSPPRLRYVQSPAPLAEDGSDGIDEEHNESDDMEDTVVSPHSSKKPTSPRKPRSMKLLTEINFNDATPTLKEFAGIRLPKTDMQRYLVIAYWFKHHNSMPDISPDHFFTAYRHLQWTVPTGPASPIRDLRHKRRTQLSSGASHGTSTINHVGEEIVLAMGKAE
jgi:hypothetical protein